MEIPLGRRRGAIQKNEPIQQQKIIQVLGEMRMAMETKLWWRKINRVQIVAISVEFVSSHKQRKSRL